MKILFDHPWPFALAHGGFQIQIEQSKAGLERRGVEVEHVRWWDDRQTGDIIHYFGRPAGGYIDFAHGKGMKVVVAELHTGLGSRSTRERNMQKTLMQICQKILPGSFTAKLAWDAYRKADAFVALTTWEARLMQEMFGADPKKIRVVPNGVEAAFFAPEKTAPRSDYLVYTGTIHPRKRVVELAEAAIAAGVPLRIIGKPYAESEVYYRHFLELQKSRPDLIRYNGAVSDRAELAAIYQEARGFVLLSAMESLSISALEAAASRCPLLLSDLPWARSSFGDHARYATAGKSLAQVLGDFYREAPSLPSRFQPLTWDGVAEQLEAVYRTLLKK